MTSNLPPGVRESDIPGYNDTDGEHDVTCPECGWSGEVEGTFTPGRGRYSPVTFTGECPRCGADVTDDDAYSDHEPHWESIAEDRAADRARY